MGSFLSHSALPSGNFSVSSNKWYEQLKQLKHMKSRKREVLNSCFLPNFFSGIRILLEMAGLTAIKKTQHKINDCKHEPIVVNRFLSLWLKWIVSQEKLIYVKLICSNAAARSETPGDPGAWFRGQIETLKLSREREQDYAPGWAYV